ncbi:MAG: elongation factor 4 [Candidatus Mcinerneyibacterium aminivorans]|uniref:Elongation factor 4 n=1 Tax=Candidatus Mcinerneyibacterium aminivorans TaxID=2703815 RepID=A0A5D0MK61_9BACT|nr:MAG: elongation factor 4 [Candidatus Mcinerneyibacterium aminivorans]
MDNKKIRNFSIIAHIDHGKSTLADRILEFTNTIEKRDMQDQFLDTMDIERERGITVKSQAIRIMYKGHKLHLIDTPGHVDFSYEVSRALKACEGALLIIDGTQGIQAQTMANVYLAMETDVKIIPVINKIDLPGVKIEETKQEIYEELGYEEDEILLASAKEGIGIEKILDTIIERIPAPAGDEKKSLKALIFDSHYNSYQGVILYVRIIDGEINKEDKILLMGSQAKYEVHEIGIFEPKMKKVDKLTAGDVGYITAGIKDITKAKVGDTITSAENPVDKPLPGYREMIPMVYCGMYPTDNDRYNELRDALDKLALNDAAIRFEPDTSEALGFGFRVGFLGLLHMEVTQERLEREFDIDLVITTPNVVYKAYYEDGEVKEIHNPAQLDQSRLERIEEPYVKAEIITPDDYIGPIMKLCTDKNADHKGMEYLSSDRVLIKFNIPLRQIIFNFYDRLKSVSSGYASLDYDLIGYKESDLVKLTILVNKKPVDALTTIVHRDDAHYRGRQLARKLKEHIPRQLFKVPIQASIGKRVVSRVTVKALRKNVTSKCYGGDVSRKKKLLEKQKEGKKRMKKVGSVDIPQEAFLSILEVDDE